MFVSILLSVCTSLTPCVWQGNKNERARIFTSGLHSLADTFSPLVTVGDNRSEIIRFLLFWVAEFTTRGEFRTFAHILTIFSSMSLSGVRDQLETFHNRHPESIR